MVISAWYSRQCTCRNYVLERTHYCIWVFPLIFIHHYKSQSPLPKNTIDNETEQLWWDFLKVIPLCAFCLVPYGLFMNKHMLYFIYVTANLFPLFMYCNCFSLITIHFTTLFVYEPPILVGTIIGYNYGNCAQVLKLKSVIQDCWTPHLNRFLEHSKA